MALRISAYRTQPSSVLFYNKAKAYARERAEKAVPTIPTEYFNLVSRGFLPKGETDPQRTRDARAAYDAALAQEVLKHNPDLVVLAGWMHVFSAPFLRPLDAAGVKIINLHRSTRYVLS
jgi:phosphoribosylglycinamide formyltransferase